MNESSSEASIRRFAGDLTQIREERGLTHDDIHTETRVARDLIKEFESGALFHRSSFNRVYLRSLTKSYAATVGITPSDRVLDHLEAALEGRYMNELAVSELGADPIAPPTPTEPPAEANTPDTTTDTTDPDTTDPDTASPKPTEDDADAPPPDSPAPSTPNTDDADDAEDQAPSTAASSPAARAAASDPDDTPDPKAPVPPHRKKTASPPSAARRSKASPASPPSSTSTGSDAGLGARQAFIVGGLLLLIAVGVIWLIARPSDAPEEPPPSETTQAEPAAVDTTETEPEPAPEPIPPVELGDTLRAMIHADAGAVQGVRVQRDADIRRPYWLNEGETMLMLFQDRFVIEEQFDQFSLYINERPMPLSPTDAQGRRVVDREDLQAWADTLQAEPVELPSPQVTHDVP